MKFLILLFLTFSAMANYIPESKIGIDTQGLTVFMKKNKCEKHYSESCMKIPFGYNAETFSIKDQMIDDASSPILGARSMIESCTSLQDCSFISSQKACTDGRHSIYSTELLEVWCNKIVGYNQKLSGQKIVVEDAVKKAQYDIAQAQKKAIEDAIKLGNINRAKCKDALDFIAGQNSSSGKTIAEIDLMMSVEPYKSIYEALQANRIDKARLKLQDVVDPAYESLKLVLISILE